jgi:hypothetical protein
VIGLIGTLVGLLQFVNSQPQPQGAESKLRELDQVRRALSALDTYVQMQQRSVVNAGATLSDLRSQKSELDKVVSSNGKAAEALLRYQEPRQSSRAWVGYTMSFILGVFSSLTATFLLALKRGRASRSPQQPPGRLE